MSEEIIPDNEQELVDHCKDKLLEHFDSVQIFVTRHSGQDGDTAGYESGGGNFYARLGQVREWIGLQDQYQRNHAMRVDPVYPQLPEEGDDE